MTGSMTLLVGLLFLSYLGSSLGRRGKYRIATNSGIEHVILGLVLGPLLLGLIQRSWAELFEPVALVGAGWLGFVAGSRWHVPDLTPSWSSLGRGILFGLLVAGLIMALFSGVWLLDPDVLPEAPSEKGYVVLAMLTTLPFATPASTSSILTRYAVSDGTRALVLNSSRILAFFPVVAAMVLFGFGSHWTASKPLWWVLTGSVLAPIVVGALLGLITAGLISRFVHAEQAWGVILGTTLLGAGFSIHLGLSAVCTLFFIGLTLSPFHSVRPALQQLTETTERPVLLPVALLLGASLRAEITLPVAAALGALLFVRTLVVMTAGWFARIGTDEPGLGASYGLLLTMPAALPLALRSESSLRGEASPLHMPLLLWACFALAVHEILGQLTLRRLDQSERSSKLPPAPQPVEGAQ